MALPGHYLINYTDPRKESFIIEPFQTDGGITPTSNSPHGSARRISTPLLLYGRDVPNYGERIAENFVQHLENFAGPAAPFAPIEGQLWFDTGKCYKILAWTNAYTLTLKGDVQSDFVSFISDEEGLTIAFRPVNSNVDNSLQQIKVLAKTVSISGGNTVVTFVSSKGEQIQLPPTVVEGFIAAETDQYSRMCVATSVPDVNFPEDRKKRKIKWLDITNVYSSADEPNLHTRTVGDLWLDEVSGQLHVYNTTGQWTSVAARYLPLTGGTMAGDIRMNTHKVYSSAPISPTSPDDKTALVNRDYVDVIETAIRGQVTGLSTQLNELASTGLGSKVNKSGDVMTGGLKFGGPNGIDMNNNSITNLPTMFNGNFADPTNTQIITEGSHAVTKMYVARAFAQHILDQAHGAGGFIQIQPDGTGRVPENLAFVTPVGLSKKMIWRDVGTNNQHSVYANFSGTSSQFVIEAGHDANDTIDIRHTLQESTTENYPLMQFGVNANRSYKSLYIFDGQPRTGGTMYEMVDENKAATKGYVNAQIALIPPPSTGTGTTVTSIAFGSTQLSNTSMTYSMTLTQDNGAPTLSTDMYHKHLPTDITLQYTRPLTGMWEFLETSEDLMSSDLLSNGDPITGEVSVVQYLNALAEHKAPLHNAEFGNLPHCGYEIEIVEYNTSAKTIRVEGNRIFEFKIGCKLVIDGSVGNDGVYTIVNAVAGVPIGAEPTTVVTVKQPLAVNGAENSGNATILIGQFTDDDQPSNFITRTTLDYEIDKVAEIKRSFWKATSVDTNVVHSLGFTYSMGSNRLWVFKNGLKQRNSIMSGGTYNETTSTTITISSVEIDDEFEFYEI